jgi:HKD family nuclease
MPTSEFILQGLTPKTHFDALEQLFDLQDIESVLVSVAFVSEKGAAKVQPLLQRHAARSTVFAGIRNGATSYQGLVRLHGMVNLLYVVDTGSQTRIFHPKLYLVRASTRAKLLIGSANLTASGLSTNIEAGMLLDYDLAKPTERSEIDRIEMLFLTAPVDHPANIIRVPHIALLDEFLAVHRLIDERLLSFPANGIASNKIESAVGIDEERWGRCPAHEAEDRASSK